METESFNLDTPPEFRGLHPDLPVRMYSRRLPHWRQTGATYFVTFRLADSIPQSHLRNLKRWRQTWERANPLPRNEQQWLEIAQEISRKEEAWLDEGYGECVFQKQAVSKTMYSSLLHFQHDRVLVSCFVVMANHIHAVMKPLGQYELEDILASIKQYVSCTTNKLLNRKGRLWEEESFDRIIRDEEHLYRAIQYIGNNPAKAGLSRETWVRWICPSWQSAGWGFRDK